jgi:RNase H-like domain found in reverse transcriptase
VEFLEYIIDQGTIRIDPSKKHGLEEWLRELKSVKEVHSTLGVLGYQYQFIPNFAHITQPLTALLKKGVKFQWLQACTNTVDALIDCVICDPVLQRPDTTKPFVLEVDASQYASGAILHQPDEQERLRPVAYYSWTFNGAERNYNIHDRELLAIMRGLEHWRHLILSSPHKLTVISNHANLQYYREAHHINHHVAHYLPRMAEFNMTIIHRSRKTNKADPLSRPPGCDQGDHDHDDMVVLPPKMFVRLLTEHQSLQRKVKEAQDRHQAVLEELMKQELIEQKDKECIRKIWKKLS